MLKILKKLRGDRGDKDHQEKHSRSVFEGLLLRLCDYEGPEDGAGSASELHEDFHQLMDRVIKQRSPNKPFNHLSNDLNLTEKPR